MYCAFIRTLHKLRLGVIKCDSFNIMITKDEIKDKSKEYNINPEAYEVTL